MGIEAYKWRIYQVSGHTLESNLPCALFFHEEDAQIMFSHLKKTYSGLRFVLTNIHTGNSYVG